MNAITLQGQYNQATQIRCPGERVTAPRTWPTGGKPVDVHDSIIPLDDKAIARFWSKVDMSGGPAACWPWMAGLGRHGYGKFWNEGRTIAAHRVALTISAGAIPYGAWVLHSCDVPGCCNPMHLRPGSHAENMADMKARGRAASGERHGSRLHPDRVPRGDRSGARLHPETRPRGDMHPWRRNPDLAPRGTRNGRARLTEDQVLEIRRLYDRGVPVSEISGAYGVTSAQVSRIGLRLQWQHVAEAVVAPSHLEVSSAQP